MDVAGNRPRTLVVEDDAGTLLLLMKFLAKRGFDVQAFDRGEPAWDAFQAQPFPIVVLDWMLPGMSGLELCRKIRASEHGEACEIMILTGLEGLEQLEEALEAGADDYLVKPVDPKFLSVRMQIAARHVRLREERRRAIEELKVSLDRFDLAVRASADGLWDVALAEPGNLGAARIWYSQLFKSMLGYSPDEFADTFDAWFSCIHPADRERMQTAMVTHRNDATRFDVDYRLRVKSGEYRWFRTHGQGIWDEQGRLTRISGCLRDVTAERQHKEELATRHRELTSLHQLSQVLMKEQPLRETCDALAAEISAATGFPIVAIALRGQNAKAPQTTRTLTIQILRGHPAGLPDEQLQLSADLALGDPLLLAQGDDGPSTPDAGVRQLQQLRASLGLQTIVSIPMKVDDELIGLLVVGHPQAHTADAQLVRWLSTMASHIASFVRRRLVEEAYRESEERFSQFAANVSHVFWMCDADVTRVLYVSQAYERVWGRPAADLYASSSGMFDGIHPDDLPRVRESVGRLKAEPGEFEFRLLRTPTDLRWIHTRAFPISDAKGKVYRVVGISEDVTERRALETQLLHSQKLESIGQLAAGIAHEINTPTQYVGDNVLFLESSFTSIMAVLQACANLAEATGEGPVPPERLQELRGAIDPEELAFLFEEIPKAIRQSREGLQRVTEIVRAMKEFSHPVSKEKTPVNINNALRSSITVCRNEWKYVADVETDFDDAIPPVECLPNEMNQVYLNILVNAAHAIADVVGEARATKGKITVSTRLEEEQAVIRIADTGAGIPEGILPRIFEPFFTTKTVGKGTGQGLPIARSVVVGKHGGTLTCETEVGRGTTFVIRLPLSSSPLELAGARP